MTPRTVAYRFVDAIPSRRELDAGVIYVSLNHTTAVHLCMCGCGNEVVTPIRPDGWTFSFNGEQVSLRPSIGNWRFPCRSHYFITDGLVRWVPAVDHVVVQSADHRRVARWWSRSWRRLWGRLTG